MRGQKDNSQELLNQICKAEGVTFDDNQIVAISKFVDKTNDNLQRMWNTVHDVEEELWELRKFKEATRTPDISHEEFIEKVRAEFDDFENENSTFSMMVGEIFSLLHKYLPHKSEQPLRVIRK